jgi:hypothetical protein
MGPHPHLRSTPTLNAKSGAIMSKWFHGDTFVRVTAIRSNAYKSASGEPLRTAQYDDMLTEKSWTTLEQIHSGKASDMQVTDLMDQKRGSDTNESTTGRHDRCRAHMAIPPPIRCSIFR